MARKRNVILHEGSSFVRDSTGRETQGVIILLLSLVPQLRHGHHLPGDLSFYHTMSRRDGRGVT
jgi:hypothetical protein